MVDPISDTEREEFYRRVKVGFVLLMGLSAGLITLQGDPSPVVIAGAIAGGLVTGALLAWFIFPSESPGGNPDRPERDEDDGEDWRRDRF